MVGASDWLPAYATTFAAPVPSLDTNAVPKEQFSSTTRMPLTVTTMRNCVLLESANKILPIWTQLAQQASTSQKPLRIVLGVAGPMAILCASAQMRQSYWYR